jgi:heptosyltransferase-2
MSKRYIYIKKRYILLFTIIDFLGSIIFSISRFFFRQNRNLEVKKILVLELAHIGDVIAVIPAVHLLRKRFPNSSITAVVGPWAKEVLVSHPDIDEIFVYRAFWFDRANKPFSLTQTLAFINFLRKNNFDLGIDTRGDFGVILLMWLGRVRKRIGYAFAGGAFLLSDVVPFNVLLRQDKHQIEHNMSLISSIPEGQICDDKDLTLRIFFSSADISYVDKLFKENAIVQNDSLIAIHLGAGFPSKRWPTERFSELIEKILKRYSAKIVLVGGEEEISLAKSLGLSDNFGLINAIGKTSIKQLAALLKRCILFVGADSGVMHIAATQNTPIVAIWGGQNKPVHWKPFTDNVVVVYREVECSPCGLRKCKTLKCLRDISVDDVWGAVSGQLNKKGVN